MKILVVLVGFILGGAAVTGTAVALDQGLSGTSAPRSTQADSAGSSVPTTLTIQHVLKGCHVFANGSRQAASMRLSLKPGARLRIVDQDIDPHGLVQLAGPRLNYEGHMMMGQRQTITFTKPGVYRLRNKVVEMGKMATIKTIGPDNVLLLTVTVS
jgi:hypothetical protein